MSYESLAGRYPEIQRLFDRICTLVNDEGRMPAELLPDVVRWLKLRIKEPDDLREAVKRAAKYLKYLSADK